MKTINLDHVAASPILPEVADAMIPFLREKYGNPSSIYSLGEEITEALEEARDNVANLINAHEDEIIFTSGGTESNNWAVKGVVQANRSRGNHLITSSIEHFSTMHAVRSLENQGIVVTWLPVDKYGMVNPDDVEKAITPQTALISVMHANNEIGSIEPIAEIGQIARKYKLPFHTDAVATAGVIPVDVEALNVDLLSLSASPFYGPLGVGALYIRRGTKISPFMDGGRQERGFRAGTENVLGIVGMGKAAEIASTEMSARIAQLMPLRERLIREITAEIEEVALVGHPTQRLPGNASFVVRYIEGESMLLFLDMDGIQVASGSACISMSLKASHVLLAMGIDHGTAQGSLLLTLGIENTDEDVNHLLRILPPIIQKLRDMSPLYKKMTKVKTAG
ncbi:MAG: aminotransferase class V-fold PLP-dependent enzyme [Deltaproteobacteria bacterium]|nr:aminotransferase class V-fold PLP-dependent enzyme [Deltaproteobacteria bacterium]